MASQSATPPDQGLAALLIEVLPGVAQITDLARLTGGASRETWRFTADGRPLVVQLQRSGDELDMLVEAAVVGAAGIAGVPVPSLVASGRRDDGGAFMVVEAIDGETIARKIQRDDEFADARASFAAQSGAALAQIHAIDPDSVVGLVATDQIEQYTAVLDELGQPHPVFELARNWLLDNRRSNPRRCLVHGDFRLGNLIVGADGLRAVIDWELAHIGDPMEDLGWLCVKAWRFGGAEPVGGVGSRDELFAAYEAAGGGVVDPDEVHWWEVLGVWKWGIMCILQAEAHRSGRARSHELAAIGRRVCENEFDLLDPNGLDLFALSGRGVVPSDSVELVELDRGPHDVPSAIELIEAVREWIEGDLRSGTDGRLQFHGRVAANVLAMVERELTIGPPQAERHRQRLAELGVSSDRELADAIRHGRLPERERDIELALYAATADKLRVANPRYLI
jgi:aminoglycoside phosphotransferase (APT) family kinase protein